MEGEKGKDVRIKNDHKKTKEEIGKNEKKRFLRNVVIVFDVVISSALLIAGVFLLVVYLRIEKDKRPDPGNLFHWKRQQ